MTPDYATSNCGKNLERVGSEVSQGNRGRFRKEEEREKSESGSVLTGERKVPK